MSDGCEMAIGIPVVIFFVLGTTNSLNLLDGLDGLCGGVTAIITLGMLLLAIHRSTYGFSEVGDMVRVIVCLALVGGVCGFLPFNRHPAKIFMGDAGSMMLGFAVAALMMLFARTVPAMVDGLNYRVRSAVIGYRYGHIKTGDQQKTPVCMEQRPYLRPDD